MRRVVPPLTVLSAVALLAQPSSEPPPQSLEQFQTAAARVLADTGVAGAGLALVRSDGVEWAGGIGYADRARQVHVTADTHFRLGSISKTFVAAALVQLSEDGFIDLDAPVADVAPEVQIDNPWHETDPVRVIHLLQHTAGFDDMHFNEIYLRAGEAEQPLADVLRINPNSRRVRWRPGTRMSYSNPGYAVAGLVLEKTAAMPYEDYIEQEIFAPLDMETSTFRLTSQSESLLAQGYADAVGDPAGFPRIHLRPAGNLQSSAREMGRFVQMLLGWGELGEAYVLDPEYLSNMEYPRTTLASEAGLRNGYGSGISALLQFEYPLLGHGGGISGFTSQYAYSPSRDAGFVILLNSGGVRAREAIDRLSALAIGYLKRDVEPPARPEVSLQGAELDRFTGYYHDANPRNQFAWPVQWPLAGRTITRDGNRLYARPLIGQRVPLVPTSETTFRHEHEIDASMVFTTDGDGRAVMAGPQLYAERTPRWRVDIIRLPLLAALLAIASVFVVAIVWVARVRRARPRGFWELKIALLLCPLVVLMPVAALSMTPMTAWGVRNTGTMAAYVGTLAIPVLALIVGLFTLMAAREGGSRNLTTYAGAVALAMGSLSLYLSTHDVLGLRTWLY